MKKVSKKMVGDFLTETKSETQWSVFSFNKKTGVRESGWGGHDFFSAFAVMTTELHRGFDVILTNKIGWDFSMRFEMNNKRRITYNEMKPFEIYVREYSFDVVSPSK